MGALPRLPQNAGTPGGNLRPGCRCKPTAFFAAPGYSGGCPEGGRTLSKLCFVAALNFCINALLLAGTGNLTGKGLGPWRLLLASALGAAYAGACLRPALRPLAGLPWRLAVLGAMALVAYGPDGKTGGVFVLLTMALGYAVNAAGRGGVWQLPVCLAGVQLLGRFALGAKRIIPVEISGDGTTVHLRALWDTGNRPDRGPAGPASGNPGKIPPARSAPGALPGGGGKKRTSAGQALSQGAPGGQKLRRSGGLCTPELRNGVSGTCRR